MRRFMVLALLVIGALSVASVGTMSGRLPAQAHTVLVIEDLENNYNVSKKAVLMDMVLNQLAIEQLIAQYVEMLAYNNGLDPKDIYKAFDGDLGLAVWVDSEGTDRLVIVLGPTENPKALKAAIEKILPQLLPSEIELNIAVDQEYLFIGDIEQYAVTEKGFNLSLVTEGLTPGFAYFYSSVGDVVQKGSLWNEEGILIAEALSVPLSEETRERFSSALEGASVVELEAGYHLPLVSGFAKINDLSFLSDLNIEQLGLLPLELGELKIGTQDITEFSEEMTGEIMVDANISVDDIFASLMGSEGTTSGATDSVGYSYVLRAGYSGTLDDLKFRLEKADPDLKILVNENGLSIEDQYIWVSDGWLYVSSSNQVKITKELQEGAIVSDLEVYNDLLKFSGSEGFARLFLDSGYILTGLMGVEIESGVLVNSQYVREIGGIRSTIVIK
ncbi:hypothetical protein BG32_04230 [Mesotoga sp. HF07.pep.5.2.highcov]|uniref:hypothetical protein n=1 Tax=Mesotoga sp. HF07.pep.5.2.highcov TaxID=1462923 RepID=UPI000EF154BA|nr:hypothetical protein [Mesotoga sp. HF07.pep.5.2.highcov]RLL90555.1 hypothetical protein BG32_04230 [Mesotoga sp. HF07.pep.5.2.highcov]